MKQTNLENVDQHTDKNLAKRVECENFSVKTGNSSQKITKKWKSRPKQAKNPPKMQKFQKHDAGQTCGMFGTSPGRLRDISGTSPGHLRDNSGTSPGHLRDISGTSSGQLRDISGTSLKISEISRQKRRSIWFYSPLRAQTQFLSFLQNVVGFA